MIQELIPSQGFERIRDRTMSILLSEFDSQAINFYNTDCEGVKFFAERLVTMDKTEADYINISLLKGDYSNKDIDYVDGTYQYVIEVVTNAKTSGVHRGDKLANFRLQRLIGIVRYILEASMYATLNFDAPFILHTELSKFQIYKAEPGTDALNTAIGQAIFTVRCGEETKALDAPYVTGSGTDVRLELTQYGYQYGESYSAPLDSRFVYIVDQDDNVLAMVPGGQKYTVTVLTGILQTLENAPTTIIQNIIN